MKTKAAILMKTGKPLILEEIEIPDLKPGQVLVDIAFSGICHTQILEARGYRGEDKYVPHCLGHEGSGIIRKIGEGVKKVKVGDKVILSWMKGSGADIPGMTYKLNETDINSGAITTFSNQSVISENRIIPLGESDVPLKEAALLGCAIPTGLGSVFNVAKASKGQNMVVFGIGGVGLCAVAGAKISGCNPIIAVDILDDKLDLAKEMGATHLINTSKTDAIEEIMKICPNGVDFSIECSGITKVMLQAIKVLRIRGGSAVIVGNANYGQKLELDPHELNLGKRIFGTWGGDNVPDRDFPKYIELLISGKLNIKKLLSKTYDLENINEAIDDLEKGKVIRPIIEMGLME